MYHRDRRMFLDLQKKRLSVELVKDKKHLQQTLLPIKFNMHFDRTESMQVAVLVHNHPYQKKQRYT